MPLPVAHSMMGYVLHDTLPQERKLTTWKSLLLFVLLANLPDIDFLPGLILGKPNLFHRHYLSHSLGISVMVGFVFAMFTCHNKREKLFTHFLIFTSVYFSHVFLDAFSFDTAQPVGVPMLWPFSQEYIVSPFPIFIAVKKSNNSATFFQNLFIMHNLGAALWEFLVFVPVVSIIKLAKHRKTLFRVIFER
ncbi:MAG: metal-dependent hydrolase [bacterium]